MVLILVKKYIRCLEQQICFCHDLWWKNDRHPLHKRNQREAFGECCLFTQAEVLNGIQGLERLTLDKSFQLNVWNVWNVRIFLLAFRCLWASNPLTFEMDLRHIYTPNTLLLQLTDAKLWNLLRFHETRCLLWMQIFKVMNSSRWEINIQEIGRFLYNELESCKRVCSSNM